MVLDFPVFSSSWALNVSSVHTHDKYSKRELTEQGIS